MFLELRFGGIDYMGLNPAQYKYYGIKDFLKNTSMFTVIHLLDIHTLDIILKMFYFRIKKFVRRLLIP